MRYWLLTTEYPPFYGGGISTYCYFTAKMLAQKGHEVTVFLPDQGVVDYQVETEAEIKVVRFNVNRSKLQYTLGYTARLSYEFAGIVKELISRTGKPDYIEAQDYLGIAYYLQQFKLTGDPAFQGIPILLTLHSPAFIYLEYNRVATYKFPDFWTCEMEKQAIAAAEGIISPTHFLPQALKHYMDVSKNSFHVIPNPYEMENDEMATGFQRNKILYYGKLSAQKGTFALLEYWKEIWEEGYEYCLELVGGTDIVYHPEGKTMGQVVIDNYKQYIDKGLLKIVGKIAPAAITEKLQQAHVVLVPSTIDNLPYVVLEAMSRGKVVLASVQGGQKEIIEHGVDGYLFDHTIDGDFKKQLVAVLELSDVQVLACGKKAWEKVARTYGFEKVYNQKIAFLKTFKSATSSSTRFPFLFQETFATLTEEANPLLSVVIPYYNMGRYIQESITSVLQATYAPLEIIIVNDGSTDAQSISALEALSKHKQVTVYNTKNNGLAAARNFGAENAQGRYLAFLDADDKVAPEYFQKAIQVLARYENVFFVGAWTQYFENSTAVWPTFTPQPPYALVHNPVNSSGLIYKKAAFLQGGRNDKQVDYGLEDYESVVALLHNGYNGVVLPEALFYYRVRSGSMIRNITKNKLIYSNKFITEKHKAYYAKFAPQIINLLNANGPGYAFDNPTMAKTGALNQRIVEPVLNGVKSYVNKRPWLKNRILNFFKGKL